MASTESHIPYYHHAHSGGTKSGRKSSAATAPPPPPPSSSKALTKRAGVVPLGPTFIVSMAVTLSLLFILVIMCAFISDEDETPAFASMLDDVAANTPGVSRLPRSILGLCLLRHRTRKLVLIGDDVDVDVDEPALTIRWSIIACGQEFVLEGSAGTHGSKSCGLPAMALDIYVDG